MSAPVINSITPSTGIVNGGNIVTLNINIITNGSTNFMVLFGSVQITNFITFTESSNIATLSFLAPFGTVGPVNVMVQTSDGTSNSVTYTYTNTGIPNVTSITPSSGNAGTPVTIYGNGFFGGFYISNNLNGFSTNNNNFGSGSNAFQSVVTSLIINGQTILSQNNNGSYNFIVVNNGQINILSMPYNPNGTYDIIVNTLYGSTVASSNDRFTYLPQPFSITSITPDEGSSDGGQVITISGLGFDRFNNLINQTNGNGVNPNGMAVLFGDMPASFIVVDKDIIATLPSNVLRKKNIKVTVMSNYQKTSFDFKYYDTLPKIKKISPLNGKEEDIVTIRGKNFSNVESVFFGTKEAKILSVEGTKKIRVIAPKNKNGKIEIVVNRTNIDINSPLIDAGDFSNNPTLLPFDANKYIKFSSKVHKECIFEYK